MESDLLSLKNLGNTSVNWLRTVGVHSRDDLARLGPVATYNRIRERGIRVSRVLLYALQGALMNIHWNELEPDLKRRLIEEADTSVDTTDS
jgi:DNA transformation protein